MKGFALVVGVLLAAWALGYLIHGYPAFLGG